MIDTANMNYKRRGSEGGPCSDSCFLGYHAV
jgi:hypothetical protein